MKNDIMKKDMKIKIFVSMHDDFYIADNSLLQAIQVGCALTDKRYENMLYDDEGDNISKKNKMYCELTAQYWVWKNCPDLDYYGFFHYRRYLSFNPVQLDNWENIVYFDSCDEKAQRAIMLNEKIMTKLISEYDVIYPQENPIGGDTVYEHWIKHLVKSDIDLLVNIIMEKYPQFYDVTNEVLNSKQAIHCNMFIMKKELFNDYSEWLFDILSEHERRSDHSNYTTEKYRTMGHLAERLCAIYSKYLEKNGAKICYVQRTLFRNTEKNEMIKTKNEPNRIPIVLACNNVYIKYTSVLIESIARNADSAKKYDIYILNTDINKENQKILVDQLDQFSNMSVSFINVKRRIASVGDLFVDRHLSVETYFRFFVMDIFPNLDKILYLDCDTVVDADVAELFESDLGDKCIGAVRDVDIISLYPKENMTDPEVHDNIDSNIGLDDYRDYFQAGVLLLNLKQIRRKYTVSQLFKKAAERKWKFQDQDILNSLFKNDVKYLDIKWNTLYECFNRMERVKLYAPHDMHSEYAEAKMAPKIIHYAGTPKPWQDVNVDLAQYFWKYSKTCPFFEILIHEINIAEFNKLKSEKISNLESNIANKENDIRELHGNIEFGNNEISDLRGDVKWRDDEIERLRRDIENRDNEINRLNYCITETRHSLSYRIGRFMTYIPRKIRGDKS